MLISMGHVMKKQIVLFVLAASIAAAQSTEVISPFTGKIRPDTSQTYIDVANLTLRMEYKGYGLYYPADYPTLTMVPLDNGEIIQFENIKEITLHGERVFWRKYVAPEDRNNYFDVDAEGYRRYSDVEVMLRITDWDGKVTEGMLKRPEASDVYFEGKTERGIFRLQIDQENNKIVHVRFMRTVILRCTGDPAHVFENVDYKFCPICGKPLNKVDKTTEEGGGADQ